MKECTVCDKSTWGELYNNGMSANQIAEQFSCNKINVQRHLGENGVKMRSKNEG